jgi:hypothetical protein
MIGLSIGLSDQRLLPIINKFRDGLLCQVPGGHVGERGCHQNVALCLGITLSFIDNVRGPVNLTSHGVGSGSDATSSKRLEGESEK